MISKALFYRLNCNIKSDRIKNVIRRAIIEDFTGKMVDPGFHACNGGIRDSVKVCSLGKEATDERILLLVRTAFPSAVWVRIIDCCFRQLLGQSRKFTAVVAGDRTEQAGKAVPIPLF